MTEPPLGTRNEAAESEFRDRLVANPSAEWPQFWAAYGPTILTRIHRFRLSPHDSDDVLQDVLFHLVKNNCQVLSSWDPTRSSLRTYLSLFVNSRVLDYLRSDFHKYTQASRTLQPDESDPESSLLEVVADEAPPSERIQRLQLGQALADCLKNLRELGLLKPVDYQIIRLRAFGLSFKEIGERTGLSEGTAITRFSRARERVQRSLSRAGIEPDDLQTRGGSEKSVRSISRRP